MVLDYSFIIPHKNNPALLQRCIASIPKRNDIEIIVVDDNSDKLITVPDVRVVLTKEGRGAGFVRNVGLEHASGNWILFADCDDYFTPGFIDIIDKYTNSDYDIIYFGINGIYSDTARQSPRGRKYEKLMHDAVQYKKYDNYRYNAYVPFGKMIRHDLITAHNITFDETIASNDMMFSLKCAFYAKSIAFEPQKVYTLETRQGSIMGNHSKKADYDRFITHIHAYNFLKSIHKLKYHENLINRLWRLIDKNDMTYFYKALDYAKEQGVSLLPDLCKFPFTALQLAGIKVIDRLKR
jgi:glycosyltransferase involved in cell wall biosynthesis